MKVLLDECLPRKLKRHFSAHDVATVPEMRWAGVKNGKLLRLAESAFDVFVTIDSGIQYHQNLLTVQIGVVVLMSSDNTIETLQSLVPSMLKAIDSIQPGQIVRVSG